MSKAIHKCCLAWLMLSCFVFSQAVFAESDSICSAASLTNPELGGGTGGTGFPLEHKGFGGTGYPAADGGFGGTGSPVAGGGIGGTGDAANSYALLPENIDGDTVIIGVVTGFASICVDGVEVHYDSQTPVYENGQKAKLSDLAVGKSVMMRAERADGRLKATAVGMFDALAGPVDMIDIPRGQIRVLGQTVHLDSQSLQNAQKLGQGVNVRISGHRLPNGDVVATRVDNSTGQASAFGVVTQIHGDGFSIQNTRVKVSDKKQMAGVVLGTEIRVSGIAQNGVVSALNIEKQPLQKVIRQARNMFVEGYVQKTEKGQAMIAGTQVMLEGEQLGAEFKQHSGKIIKIEARRNDKGDWMPDSIEERRGNLFERGSGRSGSNKEQPIESAKSNGSRGGDSHSGSGSSSQNHMDSSGGSHGGSSGRSGSTHGSGSGSSGRSSSSGSSGGSGRSGSSSGSSRGGKNK